MTITKAELGETLYEEVGLNKREAREFIELLFEQLRQALDQGEGIKLSGFGNFSVRDKPARLGRNPRTGEAAPISARRVVTFRPSSKLKARVARNAIRLNERLGRKRS